jgi:Tol biopolymer transport system component
MANYPPVTWIAPYGGDRPSFSRDGTRVVYQQTQNDSPLYIVDADGSDPRLLCAGTSEWLPSRADWSWSPETIAFGGARTTGPYYSTLWLIDSDGSNLRELAMGGLSCSTYPSWYESQQWIVAVDATDPKYNALWRFTVDGSEAPVQLTSTDDFCAGRPSASPGGEDAPVAFAGTTGPFNQDSNQIWTVFPPSQQASQLNPQQGRSPSWSPDGRWILYESNRLTGNNTYQLFIAPAPGPGTLSMKLAMEPYPLTDPAYTAQHAEWSRQQDRIVFERGNAENLGVIEVPPQFR